jgi:hypothetical protein
MDQTGSPPSLALIPERIGVIHLHVGWTVKGGYTMYHPLADRMVAPAGTSPAA